MAVIGGWEIFTRNGEKTGIEGGEGEGEGVGLIMGGWGIFKVSLHS